MSHSRRRLVAGLSLLVLFGVALVLRPERVFPIVRDVLASPWFPVVLVALYLARPFLGWPITILSVLVGFRYGFWVGLPLALFGAVATSLIPYTAARYLDFEGRWLSRLRGGSRRYFQAVGDLRGVVAARLVPTPAEAISGAAGVARVPVWAFVLGTAVGELPWTVAAVLLGSSLDRFVLGAAEVDWRLAVAIAVAGLALLAGPAWKLWQEWRRPATE
ncbi:TVP38/TMEM64 family protein [Halospeciosus flavus]|uniref:TVP38/TMEM64 family protein n=1 Tax=Halospeciosus flavus TaxID=3032283 RepID=A0ABD5Z995_9EURY|nr:VTT domain-containing protein [Halospeciosus flavus]